MGLKQTRFLIAFMRFADIYASENIGNIEINIDKVHEYIETDRFAVNWADCYEIEEYYREIEEIVINGFPIWDFFHISEWTKNILKKEYEKNKDEHAKMLLKTYKCYSCKNFVITENSFGVHYKCKYRIMVENKLSFRDRRKKDMNDPWKPLPVKKCKTHELGKPDYAYVKSPEEKFMEALNNYYGEELNS